jgi:signal transduction histidine kinase
VELVLDAARACLAPGAAEQVEIRGPDDLPPVWADHDRLEQVFLNLFDNATRHNPPGTRVRATATPEGPGWMLVTVADDGPGLPADLTAVMGPRRDRRSATAGAGLGLSIAKGIVEAHGGRMDVRRDGPGTCFEIRLPVEHGTASPGADHG